MAKKYHLPIVEASGKPYEMGKQIGRKCAAKAAAYKRILRPAVAHWTGMSWVQAVERSKLFMPYAEEFYPDYVEEMRGFSVGAKMPFEDVFTFGCQELLSPEGYRGCTDVAVSGDATDDGSVLVGHNEDLLWDLGETVVLVHGKPNGKPEFLSTMYAGIMPSCGVNSAGISLTGNALEPCDTRIGIPKVFPVRKVLEARRIGEALEWAMPSLRASSYNNICSDKNGEIYSIEGSSTDCAWIYAVGGYTVHTNHYVADKMQRFEADSSSTSMACSIFRYNRALRLIEDQLGAVTVESMKSIFRDHVNRPGSICRHNDASKHPLDVSETIFSVIFDLTHKEAHVLKGKPCAGEYAKISLW